METKLADIVLQVHGKQSYLLSDYYDILNCLGKGGFGTVIEAFEKGKQEIVALKVSPIPH